MSTARPIRVLLAEDDENDVLLTRRAFAEEKVRLELDVVTDGQECMDYLNKVAKFADVLRPDLLLLDINMPKKNGLEVLEEIKASHILRALPVVVLTTSNQSSDIMAAYDKLCSCYIVKPVKFDAFKQVVKEIETFFRSVVTLP
jgi:CheY-like chemotaxis protein